MTPTLSIRAAVGEDHTEILELSRQLGYPIDPGVLQKQLLTLLDRPENTVFVAMMDDQLTGYIHAFRADRLTSSSFLEIAALIVHRDFRRQGIGQALVSKIKGVAKEQNLSLRVRCNEKRLAAHRFYEELGFELDKTQKVFRLDQFL